MTAQRYQASQNRCLAITAPHELAGVLASKRNGPLVALLTRYQSPEGGVDESETAARQLLEAGCEYFVCFGEQAEELHDRIDDFIVAEEGLVEGGVTTTWHDDETAEEVAEFFVDVAAAKPNVLMVAVINVENEASMVESLVRRVSAGHPPNGEKLNCEGA